MSNQVDLAISHDDLVFLIGKGHPTFNSLFDVLKANNTPSVEAMGGAVLLLTYVLAHMPMDKREALTGAMCAAILTIMSQSPDLSTPEGAAEARKRVKAKLEEAGLDAEDPDSYKQFASVQELADHINKGGRLN